MTVLTPSLTQGLARHLAEKPISQADYEAAALFTLDALANGVAGRVSPQGAILLKWADTNGELDTPRRAFLRGALTHILEVDDLHKASVVHPGCVVVPAAWELARQRGASGHDLLKSVLWGFEACTRIGMAVGSQHYKIWHNTATCGPFGSAAAAGSLLGLTDEQMVDAFGNAGTQSAGLWQFLQTGAMSKHLHAGRGAEAGLVAAELAAHGFTGPPEILEGRRGFFAATCSDADGGLGADPGAVLANPGAGWQLRETSIKPWPSCRHTHPAINAAQALRAQMLDARLPLNDIFAVEIKTYQAALDLCDMPTPDTEYAAKFSLQHCVAAALAEPVLSFDSFGPDARANLAALRSMVHLDRSQPFETAYPTHWGSSVMVTFQGSQVLAETRTDALGDPEAPLAQEALIAKAEMLFRHGGIEDPSALVKQILALVANNSPSAIDGMP